MTSVGTSDVRSVFQCYRVEMDAVIEGDCSDG